MTLASLIKVLNDGVWITIKATDEIYAFYKRDVNEIPQHHLKKKVKEIFISFGEMEVSI